MAARFDLPLIPEEREGLARRASGLTRRPALAAVCLGELPPSVRQDCAACGLYLEQYALPLGLGRADLTGLLEGLALRRDLDGVLLWPVLPEGWDEAAIAAALPPDRGLDAPTWRDTLELVLARAEQRK